MSLSADFLKFANSQLKAEGVSYSGEISQEKLSCLAAAYNQKNADKQVNMADVIADYKYFSGTDGVLDRRELAQAAENKSWDNRKKDLEEYRANQTFNNKYKDIQYNNMSLKAQPAGYEWTTLKKTGLSKYETSSHKYARMNAATRAGVPEEEIFETKEQKVAFETRNKYLEIEGNQDWSGDIWNGVKKYYYNNVGFNAATWEDFDKETKMDVDAAFKSNLVKTEDDKQHLANMTEDRASDLSQRLDKYEKNQAIGSTGVKITAAVSTSVGMGLLGASPFWIAFTDFHLANIMTGNEKYVKGEEVTLGDGLLNLGAAVGGNYLFKSIGYVWDGFVSAKNATKEAVEEALKATENTIEETVVHEGLKVVHSDADRVVQMYLNGVPPEANPMSMAAGAENFTYHSAATEIVEEGDNIARPNITNADRERPRIRITKEDILTRRANAGRLSVQITKDDLLANQANTERPKITIKPQSVIDKENIAKLLQESNMNNFGSLLKNLPQYLPKYRTYIIEAAQEIVGLKKFIVMNNISDEHIPLLLEEIMCKRGVVYVKGQNLLVGHGITLPNGKWVFEHGGQEVQQFVNQNFDKGDQIYALVCKGGSQNVSMLNGQGWYLTSY